MQASSSNDELKSEIAKLQTALPNLDPKLRGRAQQVLASAQQALASGDGSKAASALNDVRSIPIDKSAPQKMTREEVEDEGGMSRTAGQGEASTKSFGVGFDPRKLVKSEDEKKAEEEAKKAEEGTPPTQTTEGTTVPTPDPVPPDGPPQTTEQPPQTTEEPAPETPEPPEPGGEGEGETGDSGGPGPGSEGEVQTGGDGGIIPTGEDEGEPEPTAETGPTPDPTPEPPIPDATPPEPVKPVDPGVAPAPTGDGSATPQDPQEKATKEAESSGATPFEITQKQFDGLTKAGKLPPKPGEPGYIFHIDNKDELNKLKQLSALNYKLDPKGGGIKTSTNRFWSGKVGDKKFGDQKEEKVSEGPQDAGQLVAQQEEAKAQADELTGEGGLPKGNYFLSRDTMPPIKGEADPLKVDVYRLHYNTAPSFSGGFNLPWDKWADKMGKNIPNIGLVQKDPMFTISQKDPTIAYASKQGGGGAGYHHKGKPNQFGIDKDGSIKPDRLINGSFVDLGKAKDLLLSDVRAKKIEVDTDDDDITDMLTMRGAM